MKVFCNRNDSMIKEDCSCNPSVQHCNGVSQWGKTACFRIYLHRATLVDHFRSNPVFPHPDTTCKAERRTTTRRAARSTRAQNPQLPPHGSCSGTSPKPAPPALLPAPLNPPRGTTTSLPTPHPASFSAARGCAALQPSWPGPAGSSPARPGWPCRRTSRSLPLPLPPRRK